jgi:hypothetical protein
MPCLGLGIAGYGGTATGGCTEQSSVLATELGWAVLADCEADTGYVTEIGQQTCSCLVQPDLFLVLNGGHRGQ